MSVVYKTDLTEYARQCTLQRRHYEECVQEVQKSGMNQSTAAAACAVAQTPAEPLIETCNFNKGTEQAREGSLADLLELSVEPLAWDDKQTTQYHANNGVADEHQRHSDRSQATQQPVAGATRKNANPVSYGAP